MCLNILLFWEGVVVLMRTFGLDNERMWSLVFFCQFINHICQTCGIVMNHGLDALDG